RREDVKELRANRRAAIERLSKLTGRALSSADRLSIPTLDAAFDAARARAGSLRERPEFVQLAAAGRRLELQKELSRTEDKPRVSAYGRLGFGMPGMNFLRNDFHPYGVAGVRLQWKPWDWGKSERDQRIVELQQQSLAADADVLARTIDRSIQNDLATAERLRDTVGTDERIVELRELIEKETRTRFDERVVTAAEYIDKETDVLDARLLRATHRVELAQAQARALNTLGVEIR
ncbi:MAG: TolC family protein, partial [Thermoanaerobaculia bacterium]